MSEEKQKARRMKIFAALEEMREKKESITAQKVAATVNMGKQTVLPIYREWLELEKITDAEKVELSESLQLAIKRELAREKFMLGEKVQELEEIINENNENFAVMKEEYEKFRQTHQDNEARYQQELSDLQAEISKKDQVISKNQRIISENNKDNKIHVEKISQLEANIDTLAKEKEHALDDLEKRLDGAHQKILDHWMNIVDQGRRENEHTGKLLEKEKQERSKTEKTLISLRQNENELKIHIKNLERHTGELEQENHELRQNEKAHNELLAIMGKPARPASFLQDIMTTANKSTDAQNKNQALEKELGFLQSKLENAKQLLKKQSELEQKVIKLSAYIEGMKATSGENLKKR